MTPNGIMLNGIMPNGKTIKRRNLMIPFKYGSVVKEDFFCGRDDIIERVDELFISSQNVVFYGERRMGKTSLIVETVRRNKAMNAIFIDLMGVKSEEEIYKRMIKSLLSYNYKKSMFDIMLNAFSNLRPQLGIDPVTQLPTLSIDNKVRLQDDSLDTILRTILVINKKEKIIIIMDEFQDILKLQNSNEVLSKLRGKIQHLTDITFVYAGSIRSSMESIFSDNKSPFFKSAIPILVDALDEEIFTEFIIDRFKKGKRVIGTNLVTKIFQISERVSGDVQQLCEAIWSTSSYGDKLTSQSLVDALELIFSHERMSYERIYDGLTEFQLRVLLTLAQYGGREIYSHSFMNHANITNTSSLRKAIDKLIRTEIIFHSKNEFKFINPFFRKWLVAKFI